MASPKPLSRLAFQPGRRGEDTILKVKAKAREINAPLAPATSKARVPRAGRPATALITRKAAAEAALAIIDRDGLAALSLQAVARVLQVSAPSLYHHFRDKDALLTRVARCLLEEVSAEQEAWSSDWEERMIELSLATRRVMLRHPLAASLALKFFPRQIMLPAYENSLIDCPYPPETHTIINEVIEKFTYGSALFAAAAVAQRTPAMPEIDPGHFPHLARARMAAPDEEVIYVEALRTILAGLRTRYGGRSTAAA